MMSTSLKGVLGVFSVAIVLVTVATAPAAAQTVTMQTPGGDVELGTPDGQPPSLETVCDGQQGAAFGLCNAYCEAMDCDSSDAQASQQACDKVRDKFFNLTGETLPCELTCPCVDADPAWAAMVADPTTAFNCGSASGSGAYLNGIQTDTSVPAAWDGGDIFNQGVEHGCGDLFKSVLPLTQNEARACEDYLIQFHEAHIGPWNCAFPDNRE